MARAVILQHVAFEGPAALLPWLQEQGFDIEIVALYDAQPLPAVGTFDWLLILGGPMSAADHATYPWLAAEKTLIRDAVQHGCTVVGICLGAQLIATALGGLLVPGACREIGWFPVQPTIDCPPDIALLFRDMPKVLHWHSDTFTLPDGACHLLASEACANQAFLIGDRVLGLQCHLESDAATVAGLCGHCRDDLAPGEWVQSISELVAGAAQVEGLHERLNALLALLPYRPADPQPA